MADIILAILGPLIGKLGEYLVNPIKNQVSYLCFYSCNVERLRDEDQKLEVVRLTVQQAVDAENRNLKAIRPNVADWLKRAGDVRTRSSAILADADNIRQRCLCKRLPVLHYSASREAKKKSDESVQLQNTGRFDRVADPANPADLEPIPSTSEIRLESRVFVEREIMDALKDDSVYLIGLYGIGGAGKTTMVKKIEERARDRASTGKPMFEEVVMVVVSLQPNLLNIQQDIAERLGLTLEGASLGFRAERLHKRLKQAQSVLIILDDVWERLDLKEIGIPSQSTHAGCKLILTSRIRNALALTEDAKIFSLEVLSNEEAWILFKENAGNSIDSSDLRQIAEEIARECKGLPLALATVGSALRGLNKYSWKDALRGLQQPIPTNFPEVLEHVYRPLWLSYNRLESEEHRYLFLLCCLFPEDYDISLAELVGCGKGLGMFAGIQNLMDARNRVERIVDDLVSRSLLINSDGKEPGERCVKMHDVIRDMGIWIGSKGEGKHVFMVSHENNEWPKLKEDSLRNCTCMSLIVSPKNNVVPECTNCPSLELLYLGFRDTWLLRGSLPSLPENFFDGMQGLQVLQVSSIGKLPSSIHLLNNLRTLRLFGCRMETTLIIGGLINLEILSLRECDFEVFSKGIGGLKNLMSLEIVDCSTLRIIEPGALSGLVRLEELAILGSFQDWEAEEEDQEINNASLAELFCLSYLKALEIEIPNPNVIPKRSPHWAQQLEKYSIYVGPDSIDNGSNYEKAIVMCMDKEVTPLPDWFYDMAGDAEFLDLNGIGCSEVVKRSGRSGYQNLKSLRLQPRDKRDLMCAFDRGPHNGAHFPALEGLSIVNSPKLEEICNGPPPAGSFEALKTLGLCDLPSLTRLWMCPNEKLCLSNLKLVVVIDCESLSYLFSLSTAESLSQLETLHIRRCQVMEKIFKKEEGENEMTGHKISFPKLYELKLVDLPRLSDFWQGVDEIEFPALRSLHISALPRFFVRQILFDHQVAGYSNFIGLQTLEIHSIHNVRSLFSPSIPIDGTNLKTLIVGDCSMLEEVIGKEENFEETKTKRTIFPRLERLTLRNLPNILAFGHSMGDIEMLSLKELFIENCPEMKTFILEYSNLPISRTIVGTSDSERVVQPFFTKEVVCPSLVKLKFYQMSSAIEMFGQDIPVGNFYGLQSLEVESCHNLRSLFSPPVFGLFPNLNELKVKNCSMLREVIVKEEKDGDTKTKETLFPRLWKLELLNLPHILVFCHIVGDIEFPSLKELTIADCPLMETFALGFSTVPTFGPLVGTSDPNLVSIQAFFSNKVVCPSLMYLELNKIGNAIEMFGQDIPVGNFYGLQSVEVKSCHNLKSLFSSPMFGLLPNLSELKVEDCSMLQEVIAKEEKDGETKTKETLFPRLRKLELLNLPKILVFCHIVGDIELPSLKELRIEDCPLMKTFALGISTMPTSGPVVETSDSNLISIQPFFSNKVSYPKLENLSLKNLKTAGIFGQSTPIDSFCGLQTLKIESCHRMRNLLSPAISRGLRKLKLLELVDCTELQEVIAREGQEGQTNMEQILFPVLEWLILQNLPKMQKFCHMINDVELPSLEWVTIKDCSMLETFSLGPLHLPSSIKVDGLFDHDFANKFFFNFNKEISSDEIHLDNNCFTLSPRDLSIDEQRRCLARDSSSSFFTAAAQLDEVYVGGKFDIVKLQLGVVYEIVFMIKSEEFTDEKPKDESWNSQINIKLLLPGGDEQIRTEMLDEKQSGGWIDILVGEFAKQASDQIGQLEFSLQVMSDYIEVFFTKGVVIRPKMTGMHS